MGLCVSSTALAQSKMSINAPPPPRPAAVATMPAPAAADMQLVLNAHVALQPKPIETLTPVKARLQPSAADATRAVRDFAQMMLTAHMQSTNDVKAAAAKAKLRVAPPMLTPTQTEMVAELRAETGPTRDAAYIAQQKAADGQALSVQQAYASEGTAAPLKAAAAKIVPVVEHHIMMLKAM